MPQKVVIPLKRNSVHLQKELAMARTIKHRVVSVPYNLTGAVEFLAIIGREQRLINETQSRLNEKVESLKKEAMDEIKPHQERISQLVEGLFAFAEAHRDELTEGGKRKTVELPTGSFGWRKTPPAVILRNVKEVLKNLKALNLARFIRSKEEVDKEAILKEPEIAAKVKGVSIVQREEFIAKPAEVKVEISARVDKFKKPSYKNP